MVEELIAEGWTPQQIVGLLERDYGMSNANAILFVQTALGGPGDVLVAPSAPEGSVMDPGFGEDSESEPLAAGGMAWDETKHPRVRAGQRGGGQWTRMEAAERARLGKAIRDSVEIGEAQPAQEEPPEPVNMDAIADFDRAKLRRALAYSSDEGLKQRFADARSWEDLSMDDRRSLASKLEDVQDETDYEGFQPLIDRLRRERATIDRP